MRTERRGRRARILAGTALALPVLLVLTACGAAGGGSGSGSGSAAGSPTSFTFLDNTEDTTVKPVLQALAAGACSAENKALPLSVSTVPQAELNQKIQLLAGQNALPVMYAGGGTPTLTAQLYKAGDVLNIGTALSKLGVLNTVQPAAISTIKAQFGGVFAVLPFDYNIEGIFYNKKIFAANGITAPATWDELAATPPSSGGRGTPVLRFRPAGLADHPAD